MPDSQSAALRRLSDTKLTVKYPDEDVRGRKVLDRAGYQVGVVDDLFIDDLELKVRFLRVATGGFLGIGEKVILIPIDAITQVTGTVVHIDRIRENLARGPSYDPEIAHNDAEWGRIYDYYGFQPHWVAGYTYPTLPQLAEDVLPSSEPSEDGNDENPKQ